MPNTCINDLTVTGPKEDIDRFMEAAKSTGLSDHFLYRSALVPFSLESLYPMPDRFHSPSQMTADAQGENWYTWRCENWGTKWDIMEFLHTVRDKEDEVFYSFTTANSPCDQAFTKKIAADFPELTFHLSYVELDNEYEGTYEWEKGKLVNEWFNPQADRKALYHEDGEKTP
jgi:hypothetical protein